MIIRKRGGEEKEEEKKEEIDSSYLVAPAIKSDSLGIEWIAVRFERDLISVAS
jgi:hypothetical protein